MNSNSHPRGPIVKTLIETLSREEHTRKKTSFVDRGLGTMLDTYTHLDLDRMSKFFMDKNTSAGLRNRSMHLLCHAGLLRGQIARNMELADLHFVILPSDGIYSFKCRIYAV